MTLKEKLAYHKHWHKFFKEMKIHNEELHRTCLGELHFSNMQKTHYENILEEIRSMTTDRLAVEIIDNAFKRNSINLCVHTRELFPNAENFKNV